MNFIWSKLGWKAITCACVHCVLQTSRYPVVIPSLSSQSERETGYLLVWYILMQEIPSLSYSLSPVYMSWVPGPPLISVLFFVFNFAAILVLQRSRDCACSVCPELSLVGEPNCLYGGEKLSCTPGSNIHRS